jgi:ubiquitin C-terminal hydrolase
MMNFLLNNIPTLYEIYEKEYKRVKSLLFRNQLKFTPRGIQNLGSTCYLNSILQQLFWIPEFREPILSQETTDSNLFLLLKTLLKPLLLG